MQEKDEAKEGERHRKEWRIEDKNTEVSEIKKMKG